MLKKQSIPVVEAVQDIKIAYENYLLSLTDEQKRLLKVIEVLQKERKRIKKKRERAIEKKAVVIEKYKDRPTSLRKQSIDKLREEMKEFAQALSANSLALSIEKDKLVAVKKMEKRFLLEQKVLDKHRKEQAKKIAKLIKQKQRKIRKGRL